MMRVINDHQLSIYQYQIGGHNCMLNLKENNKNFLLKPFDKNEFNFYEGMQNIKFFELQPFIPQFYGIQQIDETENAVIELEKNISELKQHEIIKPIENIESGNNYSKNRLIQNLKKKDQQSHKKANSMIHLRKLSPNSIKQECQKELQQNWIEQLYSKRYKKQTKYLKFQNLTENLANPCILDLKLGNLSELEIQQKQLKFDNSTSKTFGFRICGLFKPNMFLDKYYGRKIQNKVDLIDQLTFFFNLEGIINISLNYCIDQIISIKIMKSIINQLEQLRSILFTITSFRFNSASLLLLYDYDLKNTQNSYEFPLKVLAKLIDFGNVFYLQNEQTSTENGNQEIISAIGNIIDIFQEIIGNY